MLRIKSVIIIWLLMLNLISCSSIKLSGKWLTKETDHLFIYYKPDSCASKEIDSAVEIYENAFKVAVKELRLNLTKYESTKDNKIKCYLHDKLGNFGQTDRKTRSVHYLYSEESKLISAHEIMHLLLYDINPDAHLGLEEGVCRFYEARGMERKEKGVTKEEISCPLYRLAKFESPKRWNLSNVFYTPMFGGVSEGNGNIAAAFVSFLTNKLGKEYFFLSLYPKLGHNWEEVLTTELHMSLDEINLEFQKYGKTLENPPPPFSMMMGKDIPVEWEKIQ